MFQFDHIALTVADPARSAEFYEHLGGLRVSKPSPHFIEIMLGQVRLHITAAAAVAPADPDSGAGINHFCATVSSVAQLAQLRDLINSHPQIMPHGRFEIQASPPMDAARTGHCEERVPTHTLYFRDPDGIHVEIRTYS